LKSEWDLWGQLENHVTKQSAIKGTKYSIFNGPIFDSMHDPIHRGLKIPRAYWKMIIHTGNGSLDAYAFIIGQETLIQDLPLEQFSANEFGVYQVKIRSLEQQTNIDFGRNLIEADAMETIRATESFLGSSPIVRIISPFDIVV